MQKFKLLYIAGSGRSGSTILDMILSNNQHIVGVGELQNLFLNGWKNNEYCSCGERAEQCQFWSAIKKDWLEKSNISIDEYIRLQKKFTRFKTLPILAFQNIIKGKDFKTYTKETKLLFQIIQEHTGAAVIVDSSKIPYRLWALKMMGIELHILHLIRDGRAVLNSLKKSFKTDLSSGVQREIKPKPTIRTAFFWIGVNTMVERVSKKCNYHRMRYEDLLRNYEEELGKVSSSFDIELSEVIKMLKAGESMQKGHIIAGNRLRMQKEVKLNLQPDEGWRDSLDKKDIKVFENISGGMLKRYKYK